MNTDKLWEEYKQLTHAGVYESVEESRDHFDWWIKKLEEQEAGHKYELEEIAKEIESRKEEISHGDSDLEWSLKYRGNDKLSFAASLVRSHIK